MQKSGDIFGLEIQKRIELIPALTEERELADVYVMGPKKGQHKTKVITIEKPVYYIADFYYFDINSWKLVIEDTKGMRTKDYVIKRKLLRQMIKDDKHTIFIET